jgi:hypothetical protein
MAVNFDFNRCGAALLPALALLACRPAAPTADDAARKAAAATPQPLPAFVWPAGLRVVGDGYPAPGDSCRRLGESEATANYLDDSAVLVGCPGGASDAAAAAILAAGHARVVGATDGVTLISVAQGDANRGMALPAAGQ